jgi:hypothetical protein
MIYSVGRTLFTAVGTAIVGILLASDVVPKTTAPTMTAWTATIAFVAITGTLALVATILIKKVTPMDQRGAVVEAVAEVRNKTPIEEPAATKRQ